MSAAKSSQKIGALVCPILLCAALSIAPSPAHAQKLFWPAQQVVESSASAVRLNNPSGEIVGTVSRVWIARLLKVHHRIQAQAGTSANLLLTDGAQPNAFAWSDGKGQHVAINVGMLTTMGEDEDAAAALLGHETAHLVKGHGQVSQQRRAGLSILGSIINFALSAKGIRGVDSITNLGTRIVDSSFSRDQEREADELGVEYMYSGGFDPSGAVRLQELLLAKARSFSLPFLNSHPSGVERVENMRLLAEKYSPGNRDHPEPEVQIASHIRSSPDRPPQSTPANVPGEMRSEGQSSFSSSPTKTFPLDTSAGKTESVTNINTTERVEVIALSSPQNVPAESRPALRHMVRSFASNGLAPAQTSAAGGLWGYVDKSGSWIITPAFVEAQPFDNAGWAAVAVGSSSDLRWGFINARGEWEIAPQFEYVESFDKEFAGFAKVRVGSASFDKTQYISRTGTISNAPAH